MQTQLRVLTEERELLPLVDSWRELLERSADRSVFLTPEWALTWWRHFGGEDTLHVVALVEGSELVALVPMLRAGFASGGRRLPMFVGLGQEHADYGGFLLGDRPVEAIVPILQHLRDLTHRESSVVNLTRLRPDGDVLPLLQAAVADDSSELALCLEQTEAYPYVDLTGWVEPERELARLEKRNDVRRRLRRLCEVSQVAFDYDVEPTAFNMERMYDLHEQRWSSKQGSMSGLFAGARRQRFMTEVAALLHAAGYARLSFLEADGRPVAGRFGFEFDGSYQGLKSGFDPAFARFGPGHLIVAELLRELCVRDVHEFNFMRGAGPHKEAWTQTEKTVGYWTLARRSLLLRSRRRVMWLLLSWRQRRFAR